MASGTLRSILFLLFAGVLSPLTALGAEFRLLPSVDLQQEYNDNIFFTESQRLHDFITTVSPGLKLFQRTERSELNLIGRIDRRWYLDNHDFNATDQFYRGDGRYAFTPKLNMNGSAEYSKTSRPDQDVLTTGIVYGFATRMRHGYTVGGDYALTDKTMTTATYSHTSDLWDDPRFINVTNQSANVGLVHDLTRFMRNVKGRTNVGYMYYGFSGTKIENYTFTVGASRAMSEKWSISFDAGGRYTTSEFDVPEQRIFIFPFLFVQPAQTETTRGFGWVANLAFSYKGEKNSADLSFMRDISSASGSWGATERTAANFTVSRKLTYELSTSLSTYYFLNQSAQGQFSTATLDQQTFAFSPAVRYEFNRDFSIDGSYTFYWIRYKQPSQSEAERNQVMVRLHYQYPVLE